MREKVGRRKTKARCQIISHFHGGIDFFFFLKEFSYIWNIMGTAFSFNSPSPPPPFSFCGVLTRSAVSLLSSFVPATPTRTSLFLPPRYLPPVTFLRHLPRPCVVCLFC
nr:hypothetical protein Iba_chr08dCG15770 [Ipomoea batatas]